MDKGDNYITIRRSIVPLVFRVLLAELIFEFTYVLWRIFIDINFFQVSSETLLVINSVSIIIFLVLMTVIQTSIIVFIILNWVNIFYEIKSDGIVFKSGVVSRQERIYPYRDIQSVRLKQGIMGRMFNYGTIEVFIPTLGYDLYFTEIPNPYEFLKIIKNKTSSTKRRGERFLFKRN